MALERVVQPSAAEQLHNLPLLVRPHACKHRCILQHCIYHEICFQHLNCRENLTVLLALWVSCSYIVLLYYMCRTYRYEYKIKAMVIMIPDTLVVWMHNLSGSKELRMGFCQPEHVCVS